ncbi:MAG: hypothetical protein IKA12_00930 [Clostridia bacterium]|nr:hypothetical protein [Clostridia bacterium]
MIQFTVKELSEKTLYQLREIGTKIGVRAPTGKSKHDLILSIMDVTSGRVQPCRSRAGRPRKNFTETEIDYKSKQEVQEILQNQRTERQVYEKVVDLLVEKLRNFLLLQFDKI